MRETRLKKMGYFRNLENGINFMKQVLPIVLLLVLLSGSAFCRNLEASFSYCTFYSPETGPYIETYLSVNGSTVKYVPNEKGAYQGSIEVIYIFRQGEEIKNFKKFNLLSPEITDTLKPVNFLDQQRIQLPNGEYIFEIQMSDKSTQDEPFSYTQLLNVDYPNSLITISEIELVESYTQTTEPNILSKSGYDLVPYVSDYYPETMEKLIFYAEVYNSNYVLGDDGMYLINYYLETDGLNAPSLGQYRGFMRQKANKVSVVLSEFNIKDLPSGNYTLVIETRNRQNELLTEKRLFFQRNNPAVPITIESVSSVATENSFVTKIDNADTLREYIRSLRPISTELEVSFADNQLKEADLALMQQFFLSFWTNRNKQNPQVEWLKYKQEVRKVEKAYSSSIRRGYETDRGRIYLKYGPPNTVVERKNEPNTYPYEIWHYYKLPVRSDGRFIFYNPDLVTNDYELLHSNLRGEVNDYRWKVRLTKRSGTPGNIDNGEVDDQFGNEAEDFFNMPR